MDILKEIPELVRENIISPETADKIMAYYRGKKNQSPNRLLVVFGILGAILTGLGLILIIAHNWDQFSRTTKALFAFIPLLIGQVLCGFIIIKMPGNSTWKESASAFLFFAIGACMALVSQIYHIPGTLGSFLLAWMLLSIPIIYLMNSSVVSLLFIIGITWYACVTCYGYPAVESYTYWLLLLLALPYYYFLAKKKKGSNFTEFHHWIIPLSVMITLGTIANHYGELMIVAYVSYFGLLYLVGHSDFFNNHKRKINAYMIVGSLGTIGLLLAFSFDIFWENIRNNNFRFGGMIGSPEFITTVIISTVAVGWFYLQNKQKGLGDIRPLGGAFILFIIIFMIGMTSSWAALLVNLLVLVIGIWTIRMGAKQDHLGLLNYGLLMIAVLVVCRFFDSDLSFVTRGLLFLGVGLGFFYSNYRMLKKRKLIE